jgi:hypothetical protein
MSGRRGAAQKAASAIVTMSRIENIITRNERKKEPTPFSEILRCPCCKENERPKGEEFTRVLLGDSPTSNYKSEVQWESFHWGQLKLLLSEIEFLTPYWGKKSYHVIYAGASPGVHVPILAEMFPYFDFILIDPQPSMIADEGSGNIYVMRDHMTDRLAKEFAESRYKDDILFISDVRIGASSNTETHRQMQQRIHNDMINQQDWLRIMNPVSSMLKFRLPWSLEKKTTYLSGRIYFPVFGKKLTHEARLVVDKDALDMEYDNSLYEGQMAYFNQSIRPTMYSYGGRRGCFDCTSFRKIVCDYLVAAGLPDPSMTGNYGPIDQGCNTILEKLHKYTLRWTSMQSRNGRSRSLQDDED